jgi:hypothetical protein
VCKAPRRTPPTAPERPAPCPRLHLPCTQAGASVIAGALPPSMVDLRLPGAPALPTGLKAVRRSLNHGAGSQRGCAPRRAGLWLPVREPREPAVTATRHPPHDRGACLLQRASATLPVASASTPWAALGRPPRWLALMASTPRGCGTLHRMGQRPWGLFFTLPGRRCAVIGGASRSWRDPAWAMGACDTWRPRQSRHTPPTGSGWGGPAKSGSVRSAQRGSPPCHAARCRAGAVSSPPRVLPGGDAHEGHAPPAGQRRARTVCEHCPASPRGCMVPCTVDSWEGSQHERASVYTILTCHDPGIQ